MTTLDWTPEQRIAVHRVEVMIRQRAIKHYPSTLSTAACSGTGYPSPADTAVRGELIEDRA